MGNKPEVGHVEFEQPRALITEVISQQQIVKRLRKDFDELVRKLDDLEESARILKQDEIDNWHLHKRLEDQEKRLSNLEKIVVNAWP